MTDINKMAQEARPTSDDDWGSERQITAQNAFFVEVQRVLPKPLFEKLEAYCLKATVDEMIDEALRLIVCKQVTVARMAAGVLNARSR